MVLYQPFLHIFLSLLADRSSGLLNHVYLQPVPASIQRSVPHAEVKRKPAKIDLSDLKFHDLASEKDLYLIEEKCAVGVRMRKYSFFYDYVLFRYAQKR